MLKTKYTTRVAILATALNARYIKASVSFLKNKYTIWLDGWATIPKVKYTTLFIACATIVPVVIFNSCYTFSGSTLPPHLKTVEIPVFGNTTLEPGIDNDVTTELSSEIMKSQLRPANENADATISGKVTRYSNRPHTFGAGGAEVNVEQYIVQISAEVEFYDNVTARSIYKGTVSGEGAYDFQNESEQTGRDKAVKNLVEKIIQNSVQMW